MLDAPNILVVDDDKDVCDLLEEALKQAGYNVKAVNNPELVLPFMKKGQYHLVVLDLNMPGKSGIEVLEDIRKVYPNIGVIICTGYPSVETAAAAMRLGGADYLLKPFNLERFLEAIKRAIEKTSFTVDPEERLNRRIGERIRSYRTDRGFTQKQLATKVGISKSQISQIELGSSGASVLTLFRISEALGIKLERVFEGL